MSILACGNIRGRGDNESDRVAENRAQGSNKAANFMARFGKSFWQRTVEKVYRGSEICSEEAWKDGGIKAYKRH